MFSLDYKTHWSKFNQTPALTAGLILFTCILFLLNVYDVMDKSPFILYPNSPLELNLNAISLYLLFHTNFGHWFINVLGIATPLAMYEATHGTIYTGITLNLLAVITALQYCLVGQILYPHTGVIGLSGIIFSLLSYTSYKEHQNRPVIHTYRVSSYEIKIYTLAVPFIFLVFMTILMPGSSFFGHLAGVFAGFLLGMGYLKKLFPPSTAIIWIENKVEPVIKLINKLVTFVKEEDAINKRSVTYVSMFSSDLETGSVNTRPPTYSAETRVLGA
ncbi:rhomboid protein 2 [Spathaspora passalidarum NRRL Y-27907]|uniref:Rhomboid-type serine protease 2 n=1 Tax=Spathaspora passalidarum (strain NRRL Y-27907 / 11-Y1) TaxID=619300 RepID=G3AV03_SPAPN|nr:rhomboid protein 2 [Spathaspora passalidarum NRRL Y-27907]EGW30077.1 rhomboid protein 2 [Spathaspora passalidarum NRRL Y-27907]